MTPRLELTVVLGCRACLTTTTVHVPLRLCAQHGAWTLDHDDETLRIWHASHRLPYAEAPA